VSIACILGFHKWTDCKCSSCGKTRQHDWKATQCRRCGEKKPIASANHKSPMVQVSLLVELDGRRMLGMVTNWIKDPYVAASLGVSEVRILDLKYEGGVSLRGVEVSKDCCAMIPEDFVPYRIESVALPNGKRQSQARAGQQPTLDRK
jgi:hypothetical protein